MMGNAVMGGAMEPWMIFNMLFGLLIIVGFVLLILWVVKKTRGAEQKPREESAMDILKKRYAEGEINKEEFEEKKRDLT